MQDDLLRTYQLLLVIVETQRLTLGEIVPVNEFDSDMNRLSSLHELHAKLVYTVNHS